MHCCSNSVLLLLLLLLLMMMMMARAWPQWHCGHCLLYIMAV